MKWFVYAAMVWPMAVSGLARAGECCARCGCPSGCNKVCRVVCDVKKITEPVYDSECEEFCVPGKSDRCVTRDECGKRHVVYTPTCGQVRTRSKLVKRLETKEVRTYRWVVEDLCEACAHQQPASDAQGGMGASFATPAAAVAASEANDTPAAQAAPGRGSALARLQDVLAPLVRRK